METIHEFIKRERIEMKAEPFTMRPDDLMSPMKRHFKCTLRKETPKYDSSGNGLPVRELVTWFSQGDAHKVPPTAADVLDCLASDASGYDNCRNFEDWAADYGYDPDSRTAEKIYHKVADQAKGLRHFLGRDAYDFLIEKVERL